jgi:hypothetical protein
VTWLRASIIAPETAVIAIGVSWRFCLRNWAVTTMSSTCAAFGASFACSLAPASWAQADGAIATAMAVRADALSKMEVALFMLSTPLFIRLKIRFS